MNARCLAAILVLGALTACGGGNEPPPLTGSLSFGDSERIELLGAPTRTGTVTGAPAGITAVCTVTSGSLPPGISLRPDCTLQGRATMSGEYRAAVALTAAGYAGQLRATLALDVSPASLAPASVASDPTARAGYGQPTDVALVIPTGISARAGDQWSYLVTGGSLPDGLRLDPDTGRLLGTSTASGSTSTSVTATLLRDGQRIVLGPTSVTILVDPPPVTPPRLPGGKIYTVAFVNATDGWAYAFPGNFYNGVTNPDDVLKTSDGGRTWVPQDARTLWRSWSFLTPQIGLIATGFIADTIEPDVRVGRTFDGGRTVTDFSALPSTDGSSTGFRYNILGFVGGDPDRIMLGRVVLRLGVYINATDGVSSIDGGKTWSVTTFDDPTMTQGGVAFQIAGNPTFQIAPNEIRRSTDLGVTYETFTFPAGSAVSKPSFIGERDGWIAVTGADRRITLWRTTDGGKTWAPGIPSSITSRGTANALNVISPSLMTLLATVDDTAAYYLVSRDGGTTWTPIQWPGARAEATAQRSRPINGSGGFWARGDACDTFHVTEDFGLTWVRRTVPVDASPSCDYDMIWVTGKASTPMLRTSAYWYHSANGGATWTPVLRGRLAP